MIRLCEARHSLLDRLGTRCLADELVVVGHVHCVGPRLTQRAKAVGDGFQLVFLHATEDEKKEGGRRRHKREGREDEKYRENMERKEERAKDMSDFLG